MERKIKSFTELKVGDIVLIESPMAKMSGKIEDDVCVVSSVIDVYKYPISDVGSNRKYFLNDKIRIYADECGEIGNEMIKEFNIESSLAGSYSFREDSEPIWNIRLIDNKHPKWDSKLSNHGKMMSNMLNMFGSFFK